MAAAVQPRRSARAWTIFFRSSWSAISRMRIIAGYGSRPNGEGEQGKNASAAGGGLRGGGLGCGGKLAAFEVIQLRLNHVGRQAEALDPALAGDVDADDLPVAID